MQEINIPKLAVCLRDAAQKEILPRFRRLTSDQVKIKTDPSDLVTEADEAAEKMIQAAIGQFMPQATFIGEESVAKDATLLNHLNNCELAVVVDPIDGTFNFASGLPLFAVMASVISKGEVVAGIIYDPMGDDWVIAEKGAGTHLVRPDGSSTKLQVSKAPKLEHMIGMASVGFLPKDVQPPIAVNLLKVRSFSPYRCAGHEYRTFASGHAHFLMFNKLMPWDHLAGVLISQEAGAYAARFDGSAYQPHHTGGGLIVAPDKETWQLLKSEIFTM